MLGPVSGRAEGSVLVGPKTGHMGRGFAGARNRQISTRDSIKNGFDLEPARNRENRRLGPVGFWMVRFLVV